MTLTKLTLWKKDCGRTTDANKSELRTVIATNIVGDAGLYYYYHLFAKALDSAEFSKITDAAGQQHDWRAELIEHVGRLQADDGSWTNANNKWMEGDPNLATVFSLLALSHCK